MRRRTLLAGSLVLVPPARAQAPPAPVAASFSIMADMVREIGGGLVTPRPIVGPDRDSHGFSPKPSDARIVQAARVAVANGLGFDPWMDRMVRSTGFRGPFVLAATGVQPRTMPDAHGHTHGQRAAQSPRVVTDPHAWQDLGNVPLYARNISDGLKRALPQEASRIDANAADFSRRAAETDAWVRAQIETVPAERRRVLTSHDAFGYFAAAYGVTFLAPQGVSTETEPSAAGVARLIRQIREQTIRAVFLENMSNPRSLQQIARDAGVQVMGSLYADALSAPGGPAETYLGMFRHNVPLMVRAMLQ